MYGNPEPIKLHPSNNRYFQWRGNAMVLVTSSEHFGAVCNSDADYIAYLDELQAKGLNYTRVFTGIYSETNFWCPNNTLGPAIGKLITPWARDSSAGDCIIESDAGGGKKFNLNQWNTAYFDRLKDFLAQAAHRGIIVEITLFCPFYNSGFALSPVNSSNNINGINYPHDELFDTANDGAMNFAYSMVDKFVAELENYDNFWYEVANEPYYPGYIVSDAWQENITNRIVQQESSFTYKHMIARNVCQSCIITTCIRNISIYNFHYAYSHTQALNSQSLNKVLSLDEDWDFEWYDDYAVRSYGWKWIMAGGGLYQHLDPTFQNGHWSGDGIGEAQGCCGRISWGSVESRAQIGYCNAFINSLPFISMAPSTSCIVSAPGMALALAQSGQAYAVYIYDGSTGDLTLNLPPASNYTATWASTTSGLVLSTSSFSHCGGNKVLASPSFRGDIAIKVVSGDPLPIQLASFTGTVVHNGVRLNWRTISEVNNYGFFIQARSREGEEWLEAPNSFVAGHGTTREPQDYSFMHNNVVGEERQYRLKQLDLDGTVHYSEPIRISSLTSVTDIAPMEFALKQNYPNPFNPITTIRFQLPNDGHVSLKMVDVLGKVVATLVSEQKEAGTHQVQFDASKLASGMYFYRLTAGSFVATKSMMLIK